MTDIKVGDVVYRTDFLEEFLVTNFNGDKQLLEESLRDLEALVLRVEPVEFWHNVIVLKRTFCHKQENIRVSEEVFWSTYTSRDAVIPVIEAMSSRWAEILGINTSLLVAHCNSISE